MATRQGVLKRPPKNEGGHFGFRATSTWIARRPPGPTHLQFTLRSRHNNRLRRGGVPSKPRGPRGQIQAQAQELAQPITPARVAGLGGPNGAIEAQLKSYYSTNGA